MTTTSRPARRLIVTSLAIVAALSLTACGSDDDESDPVGGGDAGASSTLAPSGADEPETTTEPVEDTPAPAEDSGTISFGDESAALTQSDFGICETVNPAFADTINIIVDLPFDPGRLRVSGDLGDDVEVVFGDSFEEVIVEDASVQRDDRTVSGTGTLDGQDVSFSFTC